MPNRKASSNIHALQFNAEGFRLHPPAVGLPATLRGVPLSYLAVGCAAPATSDVSAHWLR
jgi:hypothetical protein